MGSNLQILAGLQSQLQAEEDALNTAKQQRVYLETLANQYRSLQPPAKTEGGAPGGLPAIDEELSKLRAQLADLSAHYTDRHPDVRKVKEQIAKTEKMRAQMAAELKAKAAAQTDVTATANDADTERSQLPDDAIARPASGQSRGDWQSRAGDQGAFGEGDGLPSTAESGAGARAAALRSHPWL